MSYQIIVRTPVEDGAIITARLDDAIATLMPDDEEVTHESEAEALAYHEHRVRWYACRNNGGNGKLDDETAWVHERVNAGETLTDIGRELGVTPQALGRRLRRYRERHGIEGREPYPGNRQDVKRAGYWKKDRLARRDEDLLRALRALSGPVGGAHGITTAGDWVYAEDVAGHARANYSTDVRTNGAGRALTRLAREGRVMIRREGGWNVYKHPDWRAPGE